MKTRNAAGVGSGGFERQVSHREGTRNRWPGRRAESVTVDHRSFGDPAPRWKKTLFIAYERNGAHEVAVIAEDRRLRIP